MRESLELAQTVERLGYHRYWFAEHHNMPGIASSAPEVLIAHIAAATTRLRVGSGGSCSPTTCRFVWRKCSRRSRHSTPVESIWASAGPLARTRRLRSRFGRSMPSASPISFASFWRCRSARSLPDHPFGSIRVVPGDVPLPPVWMLASSGGTAALAGSLGLGYAFARLFSPNPPGPAIRLYRDHFKPSSRFAHPHVIVCISMICAETRRRTPNISPRRPTWPGSGCTGENSARCPVPRKPAAITYAPEDRAVIDANRLRHFIGTPATVAGLIRNLAADVEADEIMVTSFVYGQAAATARLRAAGGGVGPARSGHPS
jgi:alkanesulfonate monooxygenase SsuD/methylene tetrahydromethanopterin reductase-like flavin-dependent oxidoreductase (luciferase family)